MKIKLEKNNKMQKKNDLQFVDSKKNLKFAHLFSGKIVLVYKWNLHKQLNMSVEKII